MTAQDQELIVVGRISTPYGVRGWVKIISYTEPADNIFQYRPWYVQQKGPDQQRVWKDFTVDDGRIHGKGLVAHIRSVEDRDSAERLKGCDIAITRDQLPAAQPGEYYWVDLIGCQVVNLQGIELGVVDHLLETGANDVLVVLEASQNGKHAKERLIPFVMEEFVKTVDVEHKTIQVDWDADF